MIVVASNQNPVAGLWEAGGPTNEGVRSSGVRQTTPQLNSFGPLSSARHCIFSRTELGGKSRDHAVSDRSDSLKISCLSVPFHERKQSTGAFENVQEPIGEIRNVER
jgi:hypothetical protein